MQLQRIAGLGVATSSLGYKLVTPEPDPPSHPAELR